MTASSRRTALLGVLVALLAVHVVHAFFQGDGGWWGEYDGPFNAIWEFFDISLADPVLSAGLSDFAVVAVLFAAWMISDLPAENRWNRRTYLWLLSYALFPGLGALLYLLWLRPDHRVVAGPAPAP